MSHATTTALTYAQLQSALKSAKANGFNLTCKLNAKAAILQAEYDRYILESTTLESLEAEGHALEALFNKVENITSQPAFADSDHEEFSDYCDLPTQDNATDSLFFAWKNRPVPPRKEQEELEPWSWGTDADFEYSVEEQEDAPVYATATLPAMSPERVPSWLAQQHEVYIIDHVEYLPYELEQWLTANEGDSCDIETVVVEEAVMPQPTVVAMPALVTWQAAAEVTEESVEPPVKPVEALLVAANAPQNAWQKYLATTDPTVQQAWSNAQLIAKCAGAFCQGFLEGLSAGKRKASKTWSSN